MTNFSLEGWSIGRFDDVEWSPWGSGGNARAKILANGDGFFLALLEGSLRTQGETLTIGGAYVAATGSTHEQFDTPEGATYLSIFKL
jgi:hypothetical protein